MSFPYKRVFKISTLSPTHASHTAKQKKKSINAKVNLLQDKKVITTKLHNINTSKVKRIINIWVFLKINFTKRNEINKKNKNLVAK